MSGGGRIFLVRHGQSEGNRERRFSPNPHIELTAVGEAQARAAGRWLAERARPGRIVSSPFRRARTTASWIATELGFAGEIELEPGLREREIGELAGRPYAALVEHPSYDVERFWEWRPRGGESLVEVQARAAPVLERLVATAAETDVVVVSHGGVMLALCAHVEGGWHRPRVARNCEIVRIERGAGRLRVAESVRVAEAASAEELVGR